MVILFSGAEPFFRDVAFNSLVAILFGGVEQFVRVT